MLDCLAALLVLSTCAGPEELTVWSDQTPEIRAGMSLPTQLRRDCYAALEQRKAAAEKLKTADDVRVWVQLRGEFFLRQLGSLPARTPLNAQIVGTLQGEGYRVEKILFESQPRHHVTGNLYLPETAPPYPAVIIPCGHSYTGKAAEGYQRVSILMARNGIAAFCYDPIGQGERYQTFAPDGTPLSTDYKANPNSLRQLDPIPGQPRFNPVEEHTLMGIGSILVGRNTATYRIFDGMRCIDYLVSRPDIDPQRIGCTGNSGGGTLTAYLMALDDRILCAAPACFLTSFRRLLETSGPQDAEQNIFGQIAFGMDEADYVLMRAPRPTCLLAGTRDATFDITGTWDIFREAKRAYARFDLPERVDLVEADAPHGFTIQLRVGAVRWMRRWLLNQNDAVSEPDFPIWTDAQLQCTPKGQVLFLPEELSVFDLNRAESRRLAGVRAANLQQASADDLRQRIRNTAGICDRDAVPVLTSRSLGTVQREGYVIERLLLEAPGRAPLPALEFIPATPTGDVCLYLHHAGKQVDAGVGGPIEQLLRQGQRVLAVDLPGIGETSGSGAGGVARPHWSRELFGPDGESFWLAYLLGRSVVGSRAEDVLAVTRYLQSRASNSTTSGKRSVHVVATGTAGLSALHAAALEPEQIAALTLRHTLPSWTALIDAPLGHEHLCETVHSALSVYDLPDLIRLAGARKVTVQEPATPQ